MIHVLVSESKQAEQDTADFLLERAKAGEGINWVVPKTSKPGDDAVIFCGSLFLALGRVASVPEQSQFAGQTAYYADLENLIMLDSPLELHVAKEAIPSWKWPTYPRSYTTVKDPLIETELRRILDTRLTRK